MANSTWLMTYNVMTPPLPADYKRVCPDGVVYVLHFADLLSNRAQHYIGWTKDLEARLKAHRSGKGARMMEVVGERGIDWQLAAIFPGDRNVERYLKNNHDTRMLCPICRQAQLERKRENERARKKRLKGLL